VYGFLWVKINVKSVLLNGIEMLRNIENLPYKHVDQVFVSVKGCRLLDPFTWK